ncbi:cell-cycle control medial ring component-domain-containing protein [Leptodontidium sp. MPI-SDFR-AT-0119]|nr:cell-cycle control medial ring component-domain-containing protein [Leptodontidium sp. MPI-SDFR-AT-0119]
MTELSFAKSFLTTLDSRPTKVTADHVEDAKSYPAHSAYILPKMPRPLAKKVKLTPGAERSLSITLKSLRNPPLDVTLPAQALSTSILTLKETLSAQTSIPVAKIRLLFNKKPAPDSKVLKDLVGENDTKAEFSVMVIGGAAALKRTESEEVEPKVAHMGEGKEALKTEEFWTDLKGFLTQRLKDEAEGERVWGVFKKAVESKK